MIYFHIINKSSIKDNLLRYRRNNRIEKLILKELKSVLLKKLKDKELNIK